MNSIDPTYLNTQQRKKEHLDLCLSEDVESEFRASWDQIKLPHQALPEIDFKDVSLECEFLSRKLQAPFLISSMTGGFTEGNEVNIRLARLADKYGIAMGVGSQRVALENRSATDFAPLRKVAPRATLFANIGLVQMNYGVDSDDAQWLVDSLEAQGLILHLNALQEAIQPEGNKNFSSLLKHITQLKKNISVPLILKETGCGLDLQSCRRALEAGIEIFDIAGLGGTHWGYIEGLRSSARLELGTLFRNWGTSTPELLKAIRTWIVENKLDAQVRVIASGGIRNGLDAARSINLGADLVGMALPFLKKAHESEAALESFFELQCEALKVALFCSGSLNLRSLRGK